MAVELRLSAVGIWSLAPGIWLLAGRCAPLLCGLRLTTLPFGLRPVVFDLRRSAVGLWPLAIGLSPFADCVSCGAGVADCVGGGVGAFGVLLTRGEKQNKESEGAESQPQKSQ